MATQWQKSRQIIIHQIWMKLVKWPNANLEKKQSPNYHPAIHTETQTETEAYGMNYNSSSRLAMAVASAWTKKPFEIKSRQFLDNSW